MIIILYIIAKAIPHNTFKLPRQTFNKFVIIFLNSLFGMLLPAATLLKNRKMRQYGKRQLTCFWHWFWSHFGRKRHRQVFPNTLSNRRYCEGLVGYNRNTNTVFIVHPSSSEQCRQREIVKVEDTVLVDRESENKEVPSPGSNNTEQRDAIDKSSLQTEVEDHMNLQNSTHFLPPIMTPELLQYPYPIPPPRIIHVQPYVPELVQVQPIPPPRIIHVQPYVPELVQVQPIPPPRIIHVQPYVPELVQAQPIPPP